MHRITIGIITHKHPASLAATLNSLTKLTLLPTAKVELLVVDNDSTQSAKPLVEATTFPFAVQYAVEEKRGIVNARNKVLSLAKDADYIAFIDDDDTANPNWLATLYDTAQRHQADVVKGVIRYDFPAGKSYLGVLDIFANPSVPTGEPVDTAWTNNVLFATHIYRSSGLQFDLAFNETGGSDSHFFRCAKNSGAKLVMCQEAIVHVKVPFARTRLLWLIRRHLRTGATLTISDIKCEGFTYAAKQVLKSLTDSGKYFLRLLPGIIKDVRRALHPFMVLCFMAGRVIGLLQISPREYKP